MKVVKLSREELKCAKCRKEFTNGSIPIINGHAFPQAPLCEPCIDAAMIGEWKRQRRV